jgi:hypothetical protein
MPAEETFWTGRGKRSATEGSEESHQRRELLDLTSLNEPAWIKQPALHCAQRSETKRGLLDSLSIEDPFWVSRGKRKDVELGEKPQRRGGLLDSLSADESFWAARGRRGFLDSVSTEKPFWAAGGKKESLLMTSPSAEELLSQVSILNDTHYLGECLTTTVTMMLESLGFQTRITNRQNISKLNDDVCLLNDDVCLGNCKRVCKNNKCVSI